MKNNKVKYLSLLISGILYGSSNLAYAEVETEQVEDVKEDAVEVIEVRGMLSSIKESLYIKQKSINVVDAIVAEDIGKFPDQNIAEALQRMSGITITRNGGEGQNVTVRGLGGDYNVTTINGRRMASEHSSRDFNFDLIASELLSSVEVYKSPVAKTQEGGIGAVINIKTRRPMDLDGFTLSGSLKGIYEDRTQDVNPQASFLISDTFADDTFGALFTAVYSQRTLRTDAYQGEGFYNENDEDWITVRQDVDGDGEFNPEVDNEYGSIIPGYVRYTNWQDTRERIGASLALQWMPSDEIEINFDSIYSSYETNGEQSELSFVTYDESWTPGIPNVTNLGFNDQGLVNDLTLANGAMAELLNTSNPRITETFQVGLNTAWHYNDNLTLVFDISHSESANQNNGDNRYVVARGFVDEIRIDQSGSNLLPDVTMDPLTNDSPFGAHYSLNQGDEISDKVTELMFDATYESDSDWLSTINFGINYGKQKKDRRSHRSENPSAFSNGGQYLDRYPEYTPDYSSAEDMYGFNLFRLPADVLSPADFDNFLNGEAGQHPAPWTSFDYDKLFAYYETISPGAANDLVKAKFRPKDSFGLGEETLAIYVQANIENEILNLPFTLNLGIRAIETTVTSSGFALDIDKVKFEGSEDNSGELQFVGKVEDYQNIVEFEDSYTDILPSFNFKLNLKDDLLFRLSGAQVITRPSIDSLKAYSYVNLKDYKYYASNPGLEPLRADQFDTSLEWYFSDYGALTAAIYVKDIKSFIENGENGTQSIDGHEFRVFSAKNGEFGGSIKGVELAYQQSFTNLLPEAFNGFGVQFNYTYVDSQYDDPERKAQNLPFEGMPKNSYNAVVYYEKESVQARLAYNWRGKVMTNANGWGGPSWNAAYGQYDLSTSYDINDKTSINLSINNLTNERNWGYTDRPEQVAHLARYGRLINFGINMSL